MHLRYVFKEYALHLNNHLNNLPDERRHNLWNDTFETYLDTKLLMAGYLHVLSGLNCDHILIMADAYIWYVLCMLIYTYSYIA